MARQSVGGLFIGLPQPIKDVRWLGSTTIIPSYNYSIAVTIDHTQVGGSDLSSFPIVIYHTFPELKSVANGGFIYNLGVFGDPADFVVSSDQYGKNKYDFQVPLYDPATGTIELYVTRPNLSSAIDETFYLVFSDRLTTTFQGSDHTGSHPEWSNGYEGVYHLTGGFAVDSTGNQAHGTVSGPTQVTGILGSALNFAGGTDVVDVSLAVSGFAFRDYANPMSFEFWAQFASGLPATNATILQATTTSGNFLLYVRPDFESRGFATIDAFTAGGEVGIPYPIDGAAHHYVMTIDGSGNLIATIDGVQQTNTTLLAGALNPHTSTALKFGNGFHALAGTLDEIRLSSVARIASGSVGYAVAAYNNQKTGSTFLSYGSIVDNTLVAVTVTPGTGQVIATGFEPTIIATNNQTVTPGLGQVIATGFAPLAQIGVKAYMDVGTLTVTGFEPTIVVSNNQTAAIGLGQVTVTGFAPSIIVSNNQTANIGLGVVTATGFAPSVSISNNQTANIGLGVITVTGFAPTIVINNRVFPGVGVVTATGFAPTIAITNNQVANLGLGAVTATGFAPTINVTNNQTANVGLGVLTVNGFAPTVTITHNQFANIGLGVVTANGFAPTPTITNNQFANIGLGVVTTTGFTPTINVTNNQFANLGLGVLTVNGFAPIASVGNSQNALIGFGQVIATGFVPTISITDNKSANIDTGILVVNGFSPSINVTNNQQALIDLGQLIAQGFSPIIISTANKFANFGLAQLIATGFAATFVIAGDEDPAISLSGQFYPR